ncbi:MAG: hypothetical protein Q9193_000429 [Seirophora villosa]
MPLPKNASDDCLHRNNCHKAFRTSPPRAWEFLYYIPNEHHPIEDDEGCSAHFCLVLPDDYKRALKRGHFETWSWYDDSVIPVQVPKLVHVECLHLIRSLTQSKFGVTLLSRSVLVFEKAFERFKETSGTTGTIKMVATNRPATAVPRPIQARNTVVGAGAPLVVSPGIGVL